MNIISEKIVEKTWREISDYPANQIEVEFSRFGQRQPDLLSFMMEFTQDQKQPTIERCLYLFFVICRIFENGSDTKIQPISFEEIEKAFEKNEALMENLDGVHDRFYSRIVKVQFCSQPFVMKYILEALAEATDSGAGLSEHETGYLFFLFKTVIDVLDDAYIGSPNVKCTPDAS